MQCCTVFLNRKSAKRWEANKNPVGREPGLKGTASGKIIPPIYLPPHLVRASNRCKEGHWFNSCLRTTPLEVKEISALMRGTCETVIKRG